MRLESRKKIPGGSRVVSVKDTLKRIEPLARSIGVTRIADITHLDVLRIPNYSAILPGTEDYIWVYSGKGPTHAHARASALMECIERYSSLPSRNHKLIRASYNEMSKQYGSDKVLHVDELIEPLKFYDDNMMMDFIEGFDLFTNERIFVPAGVVLCRYDPEDIINPFKFSHTNGLASGNVIEEAICHALCEIIERDAVSLAELRSSALPFHKLTNTIRYLNSKGYKVNNLNAEIFVDDPDIFDEINIDSIQFPVARYLISRFKDEKIPLIIKDITSDIGIPTFIATSIQWITDEYGYLAEGHGTHPDARIALVRAITEVSQTRAANIQGARDDLRRMNYKNGISAENKAWQFMHSSKIKDFNTIQTYEKQDILDDIELILKHLKRAGLNKAIIVNLSSNPKVPVVRAIVPGLETFKVSKSVIGWRAKRYMI